MFTVFIDDSGTNPSHAVAIASALIVPAAQIDALDAAWGEFLHDEFIPEFHTSECMAGQPGTPFERWSWQRKKRACWKVREITKRFAVSAVSCAISKRDFDELVTGELREFGGKYHYTWAVWNTIRMLDKWAIHNNYSDPFEYIFDWMGEPKRNAARKEIESVMAQAEIGRPGFYTDHYLFRHRKDHPGLQCVDLLAWSCFRFGQSASDNLSCHPIAWETYWDFDSYKDQRWLLAFIQKREELERWTNAEAQDELRKSRRREWIEKYRPR